MTERSTFRYSVGTLALVGGFASIIGLYLAEVPEGNREALLLAIGIVLGWGSTVINGEWGSSPGGRMAAEVGAEMARKKADRPSEVEVVNTASHPVPTTDNPPGADLPEPKFGDRGPA